MAQYPPKQEPLYTFNRIGRLEDALGLAFREEYLRILVEASLIVKRSFQVCTTRRSFIEYVTGPLAADGFYAELCVAMLDGEPPEEYAVDLVEQNVHEVLCKLLPQEEDDEEDDDDDDDYNGENVGCVCVDCGDFHSVDPGAFPTAEELKSYEGYESTDADDTPWAV